MNIKVLINAYACSPDMGSEPGMAWNWCANLAKHCELYIITEGEFRDKIEAALPTLPQGINMHFYYNPVTEEIRKMCWNQGDWRFYKHYRKWQWKTYQLALDIIKTHHIDIIHQLNMIGFREPGYLWKIKDIPFIWGPVDAKEKFPTAYLKGAPIKAQQFIRLKNFITKLQLRYSKRVHETTQRASFVISASSESKKTFKKYFNIDSPLINETGCDTSSINHNNKPPKETFDLLWVGKMDFRKQLTLAIQTIAKIDNPHIKLHIVGGGNSQMYQEKSQKLNVNKQCIWYGSISHSEVQTLMQKSDLLFFTSVAEGTPHVVLEAIANGLPVICFDICGQGDSIDSKSGIKIPLSNQQQSITDFASAIKSLYNNRNKLDELAQGCKIRCNELSWENKALQMVELYNRVLKNK